jgi:hypothetical protein
MYKIARHLETFIQQIPEIDMHGQIFRHARDILYDQHPQLILPVDPSRGALVGKLQELQDMASCFWGNIERAEVTV